MFCRLLLLAAAVPALAGCITQPPVAAVDPGAGPAAARVCAILSINDTYRIETSPDGTGGMARVRTLRARLQAQYPDLLVMHAGDFLFPSLLSRKYQGAQMIDILNLLDGTTDFDPRLIVTFGNHEFDDDRAAVVTSRLGESAFRWVSSNIEFAKGPDGQSLVATHKIAEDVILPCGGFNVGIFGVTTDAKSSPYIASYKDPIAIARARTKSLKARGANVVVGLTHLDIDSDQKLLQTLGPEGPDLIVGGHEHAKQTRSAEGGRTVYKADADARTANLLRLTWGPSGTRVEHEWLTLGPDDPAPDPAVAAQVAAWQDKHQSTYCQDTMKLPSGCLTEKLTVAGALLVAEELEIRRFETNLGDYVADRALGAWQADGAQIAFINSGSLRLNYNIARGADITRRNIEELFAYTAPLRLIELDGATLQKVLDRAVSGWTGQGHWLQIAGFAFRHDNKSGTATDLTLLGPTPRRIAPTDKLRAVVVSFLLDPARGQDGYTMLAPNNIIDKLGPDLSAGPDLKQLLFEALKTAGAAGIAPAIDGRICDTERPGPCLAK